MIPAVKPRVDISEIKYVYWLIGFVLFFLRNSLRYYVKKLGEGSFMVIIQESKSKETDNIGLRFVITQHSKDSVLLDNISNYLGCGKCYFSRNEVNLTVSTLSDINNKIIALFNKYPLLGTKKVDYLSQRELLGAPAELRRRDFCKVAELIKSKDHLTKQGIEKIKRIKSNMNSKRIH